MAFGLQLDPKFWFFPSLYNYAIVYVASIFGFEDLTVKFMGVPEGLHKASGRQSRSESIGESCEASCRAAQWQYY